VLLDSGAVLLAETLNLFLPLLVGTAVFAPLLRVTMKGQVSRKRQPGRGNVVKYLCTFGNTIADVLANRGWKEVGEDETWDFVWADRDWVYSVFDKVHLEHWQRLNHFRNGKELCRKDLMAKNIKKKRRALEKEGKYDEAATYDFIPTTFMLPREYSMFVEKFKEVGGVWIMKPCGSAQGKGIFLFTRLSEISEWRTDFKSIKNGKEEKDIEAYVVQRYLLHPLLIGGKKFDMRMYCLVSSFSPLKVSVFMYVRVCVYVCL
jgi:tubulin polyglutamylase TTLL9